MLMSIEIRQPRQGRCPGIIGKIQIEARRRRHRSYNNQMSPLAGLKTPSSAFFPTAGSPWAK
jgi:hypothetical protein